MFFCAFYSLILSYSVYVILPSLTPLRGVDVTIPLANVERTFYLSIVRLYMSYHAIYLPFDHVRLITLVFLSRGEHALPQLKTSLFSLFFSLFPL